MPWNLAAFIRNFNWQSDRDASIKIRADRMDSEFDNYARGMEKLILRDGNNSPTADINWGGFRITGLGDPVDPTDAVNLRQFGVQSAPFSPGFPLVVPVTGSFGTVNAPAASNQPGRLVISAAPATTLKGLISTIVLPAAPYTVIMGAALTGIEPASGKSYRLGLMLTDGTQYRAVASGMENSAALGGGMGQVATVEHWNTAAAVFAQHIQLRCPLSPQLFWFKITNDLTNINWYVSANGKDWFQVYQDVIGGPGPVMTATNAGIFYYNDMYPAGQIVGTPIGTVYHWQQQTGLV